MEEKITQKELAESFRRTGLISDEMYSSLAERYFKDIIAHREPKWHTGDVVRDAEGVVWECQVGQQSWIKLGSASRFLFDVPRRPLKKLIEE
jgi:hypothetical protein